MAPTNNAMADIKVPVLSYEKVEKLIISGKVKGKSRIDLQSTLLVK